METTIAGCFSRTSHKKQISGFLGSGHQSSNGREESRMHGYLANFSEKATKVSS